MMEKKPNRKSFEEDSEKYTSADKTMTCDREKCEVVNVQQMTVVEI